MQEKFFEILNRTTIKDLIEEGRQNVAKS